LIATANRATSLEQSLAEAIRAFEPRIRPDSLRVTARDQDANAPVPTLVFEIRGELWAQPVPQQLFLETSIELETRLTRVVEARTR
ncbi:GPW/gp25 family protein, partial [Staphylococcus aureus]